MAGNVWKPMIGRLVIQGWDTYAKDTETARKLIGEQMANEGFDNLKYRWIAGGAQVQPLDDTVEEVTK